MVFVLAIRATCARDPGRIIAKHGEIYSREHRSIRPSRAMSRLSPRT